MIKRSTLTIVVNESTITMKKKTLLIISMLVLVMFALTACGGKKPSDVVEDNLKQVKTENASSSVTKLFNDSSLEQKYGKDYEKLGQACGSGSKSACERVLKPLVIRYWFDSFKSLEIGRKGCFQGPEFAPRKGVKRAQPGPIPACAFHAYEPL